MKLKTAFIGSQFGLILSFFIVIICGIVIYQNVSKQHQISLSLTNYKQTLYDTLQLQPEFFMDKDDELAQWAKEQFEDYTQAQFTLQNQLPDNPVLNIFLKQIQEALHQFETNLYRQIAIQKKVGFSEDQGLRYRFRNAVHRLQDESKITKDQALEILILELRRREKDYVLRWNRNYLELHQQKLTEIRLYINDLPKKDILNERLTEYETSFIQYTSLLEQQGVSSFAGLAGKNKLLAQVVNERLLSLSVYVNEESQQASKNTLYMTFAFVFLSMLISLICAFLINKRIGYGLFKINEFIANVCKAEDFSLRTEIRGDDEVTDIAQNIDGLLAHIEELINRLSLAQNRLIEDAKMASLGSMVKGFAHELNTPLGIAITSESHLREQLDQLKDEFNQGKLQKTTLEHLIDNAEGCLTLMESNLNRSATLIDSFKQVASHQEYDELVEFNLDTFLHNLFDSLKHEIEKYDVNYTINVTNGLVIKSYLGAFNQIFTILIINSLRHGAIDDKPLNIEIIAKVVGATLHFRYIDDGAGVEESILSKVFEPFVTTKRANGGTGLGLSIVYNLVKKRLDGEIEFQSIQGSGVCIYLHFDQIDYNLKFEQETDIK